MSDVNRFGNLTLKVFRPSDNFPTIVEKLQFNFDQVLQNGGGPVGDKGQDGGKGEIGATGIGQQGVPGPRGSHIYFYNSSIVNGQPVTEPTHLVDDVVIDTSGNYYQVTDIGGDLQYIFQFNLSLVSLIQYIKSQYDYSQGGSNPVTKFVLRDNGALNSATERNLVLAIRRPNTTSLSADQSEFYRLILGMDTYAGTDNSTLTLCNIIPEGAVNALSVPFSQFSFRYRDSITSPVSATKADFKYKIFGDFTTFSFENLTTAIYLRHNSTDQNLSESVIKGKNVILSGNSIDESTLSEYIKIIIDVNNSYLKPIKNLIFQSNDSTGIFSFENNLVINNRLIFKTDLDAATTTITGNTLDLSAGKSVYDISSSNINRIINGKHGQIFAIKSKSNHVTINDVSQTGASGNILVGNRSKHYLNKNQQILFICYDIAKIANSDIDVSQNQYFVEISSSYSSLVATNLSSLIHGNDLNFFTTPGTYKLAHDPSGVTVSNLPTEFMDIITRNPLTVKWDLKLEVKTEQGGNDVIQTLHAFQLDETNSDPHWIASEGIYYRNKRGDGYYIPVWSSWNQIHLSNHNISINRGIFRLPINIDVPLSGSMVINSTGSTDNQRNSNFYIANNVSGNILKSITFPSNTGNWYTIMFKDATILALVDVSCNIFPKPYRTYRFKPGSVVDFYWDGTNAYCSTLTNTQLVKDMVLDYTGSSSNFLADGTGINDLHGFALCLGNTISVHGVSVTMDDMRGSFKVGYNPADSDYNLFKKTGPTDPGNPDIYRLSGDKKKIFQGRFSMAAHDHDFDLHTCGGDSPGNNKRMHTWNGFDVGQEKTYTTMANGGGFIIGMENRPLFFTVAYMKVL